MNALNLEERAEAALSSDLTQAQDDQGAHDPCTHLANAHRLVEHFGDQLLYVDGIGWHTWNPPWRLDEHGAQRIAFGLGKIIADEAAGLAAWVAKASDKTEREKREDAMQRRFKWASTSESARCIRDSLGMAAALLVVRAEDMDANPDLLGLPSGVLDLTTGKHRRYDATDRITKTVGCDYNINAKAPTWETFVATAMGQDADLIDYVQRLAGYALSGRRGDHLLPILWGSGANGKSTFLGALQAVLGDYAGTAAPGLLIQKHGTDHPTGLADLHGKRLVIVSETGEAGRLNEEVVKALTGGDKIKARRMRQDHFEFVISHLLALQSNHRPRVTGTDEGIWRRLRLIPFTVTIPPDRRDRALPEKLRAELAGILVWCWRGWLRYQAHGFNTPQAVQIATAEYRDASDQVGAFLTECCEVGDYFTVSSGDLYRAYQQWTQDAGERAVNQRDFGLRLAERGFQSARTKKERRWRGLRVGDTGDAGDTSFRLSATRARAPQTYMEKPVTASPRVTPLDDAGEVLL
ncbi:MAG: phage/plasmid primase, P4 family [Chiayiivirga sp.]|jgi:putative DNA primase/helicase|nr:phage/plasmid primase, P4 family [Chiayiivirga sp.]